MEWTGGNSNMTDIKLEFPPDPPADGPDRSGHEWRLILVPPGTPAGPRGGDNAWVETNHPAVVECMGSEPACVAGGCQLNKAMRVAAVIKDAMRSLDRQIATVDLLIGRRAELTQDERDQVQMLRKWRQEIQQMEGHLTALLSPQETVK